MKIQRRSLKTDKQTYSVNKKKFWRTDFCMIVVFYHNNTREKCDIFTRVSDIANQLLTRHSPFAPFGQVDEWTAKPSPFSIQGSLLDFSQITAAKTLKNLYFLQTVTSKLSYKGKKTNIRKEKLKITYSVALVMAFLAAENENRQLED